MTTQTRAQQLKEIEFQTQMLNNLKKWIRNLIILSSIGIILAYWGFVAQSIWCSWSDHYDHQCDTLCCHRTWY